MISCSTSWFTKGLWNVMYHKNDTKIEKLDLKKVASGRHTLKSRKAD